MALREELKGEKAADVKSVLRMQHLQNLALWAGGKASVPSYASFLGNRLATCGEATGIPVDPSLFPCQRCESILQPGFNCTVRVETNKGAKVRRRRNKSYIPPKNIVVQTCHFCSHRNVKRGTPKYHMKEILASKPKPSIIEKKLVSNENDAEPSKETDKNISEANSSSLEVDVENTPTTPKLLALESKKKKRKKSGGKEDKSITVVGESSKKRRKGWSSLKEIVGNSASVNCNVPSLPLPLFI